MEKDLEYALTRGVSEILPSKEGLKKRMGKKKITLYQGFDPTAESLHIGHMIGIRKLSQFQKLGHHVIFLIGDFTAMIGDPSDKGAARQRLTRKQVLENLKDYKEQAGKILSFEGENKAEVRFNSSWLSKLTFEEIIDLSSHFTVQQMIERDFYQRRLADNKPIYLHEFLYPLMQGYDSVFMGVDLETGGTDQLFNMLAGRTLGKALKKKEKFVLTNKLLAGEKGTKMGKTEGNAINLSSSPSDMYGKVMALPDDFINPGIELLTDLPMNTQEKEGPMKAKKALAYEVVKQVHGDKEAKKAEKDFETAFQEGGTPEEILEVKIENKKPLGEVIIESGLVKSKSQLKRLLDQGAIQVEGEKATDLGLEIEPVDSGVIVKIGKARFLKAIKK